MEIDIGTLIYILIMIVAIVFGAFNKKKKPATGEPVNEEKSSGSFFDKLEQQLTGFVDETRASVQSVAEDIPPGVEQEILSAGEGEEADEEITDSLYSGYSGIFDAESVLRSNASNDEGERAIDQSMILELIETDEIQYPDYYDIVEEFDLGTAVIYSAIINRKEY